MTTTKPDAAREAAAFDEAYAAFVNTMEGTRDRKQAIKAAIDAFLAKALEGADEKIAEIQKQHNKDVADREGVPLNKWQAHRAELLTLVTAMSAKLKEQKAAHAKMLDFNLTAAEWQAIKLYFNSDSQTNFEMAFDVLIDRRRRLADKIEGGE